MRAEAVAASAVAVPVDVPRAGWVDLGRFRVAVRRRSNWSQLCKFAVVGGSGYVVNLATFAVLLSLGAYYLVGAVGAFLVAVCNNYTLNRLWTFSSARGPVSRQASRYFTVSLLGLVGSVSFLSALVFVGVAPLLAQALAVAMVFPLTFVANKLWSFSAQ